MSSLGIGEYLVYRESRASISVCSKRHLVFTKHNLLYELDQHGVSSSSQRIHFGNERQLNQKTNVNTRYSIFIFKKLCKVLGKIIPVSE